MKRFATKVDPLPSYIPVESPPGSFTLISPKHRKLLNSGYANSKSMKESNSIQKLFVNPNDAKNIKIKQGQTPYESLMISAR